MSCDISSDDSLVSIIMPCYNGAEFISKAIDSVLMQNHLHWELIICDDNSTDDSESIIKRYQDDRILYIKNVRVKGVSGARNTAISQANGRYISFLDCDDFWLPDKLSTQLFHMKTYNFHVCHSSYTRFISNKKNEIVAEGVVIAREVVKFSDMLTGNKIGNLTGIYDASVIGKVYQEELGHEDYLMWLNILKKADSAGIVSNLAYYRLSVNSVSANKMKAITWHYNILKNKLGYSVFKSLYYFFIYIVCSVFLRLKLKLKFFK